MKIKKKPTFIDRLFLWINFLLSAALLISYLSPGTNPAKFWVVAFFGLAYPVLLLGNLILLFYWLLRKSAWALLPLLCIAAGWNVLNRNIGFHKSTLDNHPSAPNNVRMMTYNVHEFKRYGSKNDISTKQEILAIIAGEQPDIIGFQEFYSRKHGQYDMVDSIQGILKSNSYYFEASQVNSTEAIGMAVFSKLPIVAHGMIQLTELADENQCIYIDVKKGEQIFRVYSVHLQSIGFDPQDYRFLKGVQQQGSASVRSTKRLASKLRAAFIKRSIQVFKIKEHARQCPYPYIISGDFNDTPSSFAVNQMSSGLKNAFVEKGSGLGRTYNGAFPNYQIDYIMVSPAFDVASYQIIEKKLSDHFPVRSDLQLK